MHNMPEEHHRLRAELRPQAKRNDGRSIWAAGLRAGYWPCSRAPFIRIDLGPYIFELWYGWRLIPRGAPRP